MCSIIGLTKKEDFTKVKEAFDTSTSRGPDGTRFYNDNDVILGFKRLAIMGLNELGMQPFTYEGNAVVCNGEIYGFRKIKEDLIKKGYKFISSSDCEILLPLYRELGLDMFKTLDAEFALIIYDDKKKL